MLVSQNPNYCFVHVPRTGGSTIRGQLTSLTKPASLRYTHRSLFVLLNAENYWSFCFVRNPFDWVVSWRQFQIQKEHVVKDVPFDEYVERELYWKNMVGAPFWGMHKLKNFTFDYWTEGVNQVYRFEDLQGGWDNICHHLGLPQGELYKSNSSRRRKDYHEYYEEYPETIPLLKERFAPDLEKYGYSYEGTTI